MIELFVAIGVLGYLVFLTLPGVELQFLVGGWTTLIGLVGGGSAGILYHLALRKALARVGAGTRGWLWSPVSRHQVLDEQGRREVLPWFRLGAAGFFVCLAGIGWIVAAVVRASLVG
jgi:hypothetical protein